MPITVEIGLKAAAVCIGGTVALDVWALVLKRVFDVPATSWAMVGRWIGNMPKGQFVQKSISTATPIRGESATGWGAHYIIGIGYGMPLVGLWGSKWLAHSNVLPPMILAICLLVLPYFVMMPGMGMGLAASRTPRPNVARLKSVASHSIFGLGMYATALLLAA